MQARPRIFVQIASYRDRECQWTVKDLFEKAAHPERVFVGICWQFIPGEDDDCFAEPYPLPAQVRTLPVDARESKGACWARNLTHTLWNGEEYTLQIDSHMRFEQGWDEMLLDMLAQCNAPKPVLTGYPCGYIPPDEIPSRHINQSVAFMFDPVLISIPLMVAPEALPPHPFRTAFYAAGYSFSSSAIIAEVPYDPSLYFYGEEIAMAVRLWTHGWDLFHPHRIVSYHYNRVDNSPIRPLHWGDHKESWSELNVLSFKRIRHLLGESSDEPEVLKDMDKYGLGTQRTLKSYEAFAGVDFQKKTISEKAKRGLFAPLDWQHLPTARESYPGERPRIFVQIASYRDPECKWTIRDMFAKATYPERIHAGICWQLVPHRDDALFDMPSPFPQHVSNVFYDARDSRGPCWARAITQSLWQGEEYTLQIDSHMRFEQGWDEMLLDMLAQCPSQKPILSNYPASYTPPDTLNAYLSIMGTKEFSTQDGDMLTFAPIPIPSEPPPPLPIESAFIAAGFLFGPSSLIREVPYDPNLYFNGEEISLAVRLWTHGWDFFTPNKVVIYHFYERFTTDDNHAHWTDNSEWGQLNATAHQRIQWLLGMHKDAAPGTEALKDMHIYGLGTQRTLAAYEDFAGVNFAQRTLSPKSRNRYSYVNRENILQQTPQDMANIFSHIYHHNIWGSEETRSGMGSQRAFNQTLCAFINELFARFAAPRMIDLGCGDFNWQQDLDLSHVQYTGYDIVEDMIRANTERYGSPNKQFISADILEMPIPQSDIVLCCNLFSHLSNHYILRLLSQVRRSGSHYLLATSAYRMAGVINEDITLGNFRKVDLTLEPFYLPQPLCIIPHPYNDICMWKVTDLPVLEG